jgi:translation initiation factor IF-3
MRLRPKIDDHDLEFKTRLIEEFLREGDKVKVTVIFRGREITHADIGREILQKVAADLKNAAVVERAPLMEGKNLSLILSPVAVKPAPVAQAPRPAAPKPPPPAPVEAASQPQAAAPA